MKNFSEKKLFRFSLAYIGVGYSIYIFGLMTKAASFAWLEGVIQRASPAIGSLRTAAIITTHPLPAQLVILYVVITWIPVTLYVTLRLLNDTEWMTKTQEKISTSGQSKAKVIGIAFAGVFLALLVVMLFFHEPSQISWRDRAFFSSSLGSISFLLFQGVLMTTWVIPALYTVISSATRMNLSNFTRKS